MLSRITRAADPWLVELASARPFGSGYGVGRSLLALGSLSTLLANGSSTLTRSLTPVSMRCRAIRSMSAFCVLQHHTEIARWLVVGVLVLVATGWRPRLTGVLHWWASMSLLTVALHDGGDQVAAVLSLLLIPITLVDPRPSHWSGLGSTSRRTGALFANLWQYAIRIQVAAIYLASGLSKLRVPEWRNGTAMYYFTQGSSFRPASWIHSVTTIWPITALLTWGAIALELVLAASLFVPARARVRVLLPLGIAFHVLAELLFAIPSFSLIMIGALTLLLVPFERWSRAGVATSP